MIDEDLTHVVLELIPNVVAQSICVRDPNDYHHGHDPITWSSESVTEFSSHLVREVEREVSHDNACDGVRNCDCKSIELIDDRPHFNDVVDEEDQECQKHKCIHEMLDNLRSLLDFFDGPHGFISSDHLESIHRVHHKQRVCVSTEKVCVYWEA